MQQKWTREPVIHFLMCGFAIWVLMSFIGDEGDRYKIDITPFELQRIAENYERQFGHSPAPGQLKSLISQYVEDEIAYREGRAMGIDRDDEIIRRRIIQKFMFLQSDRAVPERPDETTLERWYADNEAHYRLPERLSFTHIYFSPDETDDAGAHARAEQLLNALLSKKNGVRAGYGDAFPGPAEAADLTRDEVARIFGRSEIADKLFTVPTGQWTGPFRSGYGWHLVHVSGKLASTTPALERVRERVLADYLDAMRAEGNRKAFDQLRKRYHVIYEGQRR